MVGNGGSHGGDGGDFYSTLAIGVFGSSPGFDGVQGITTANGHAGVSGNDHSSSGGYGGYFSSNTGTGVLARAGAASGAAGLVAQDNGPGTLAASFSGDLVAHGTTNQPVTVATVDSTAAGNGTGVAVVRGVVDRALHARRAADEDPRLLASRGRDRDPHPGAGSRPALSDRPAARVPGRRAARKWAPRITPTMRVRELWRYPVKSLQGERLATAMLTADGIDGDRRWAIFDLDTGLGLTARRVPQLLFASATLTRDGHARIALPDGSIASGDDALSDWLGRRVALRSAGRNGGSRYENVVDFEHEDASAWETFAGAAGPFHDSDGARVSLLSTATIGECNPRRFDPTCCSTAPERTH